MLRQVSLGLYKMNVIAAITKEMKLKKLRRNLLFTRERKMSVMHVLTLRVRVSAGAEIVDRGILYRAAGALFTATMTVERAKARVSGRWGLYKMNVIAAMTKEMRLKKLRRNLLFTRERKMSVVHVLTLRVRVSAGAEIVDRGILYRAAGALFTATMTVERAKARVSGRWGLYKMNVIAAITKEMKLKKLRRNLLFTRERKMSVVHVLILRVRVSAVAEKKDPGLLCSAFSGLFCAGMTPIWDNIYCRK